VIDFIEDQKLGINAAEVGAYFHDKLRELQGKHPIIGDVRGMGLLQAIELVEDPVSKKPATAQTTAIMEAARENRILLGKGGLHGNVLRFSPPLNISKSDVDEFARLLDASLVRASAFAVA
jgi:4-aminobutyrate aminotransferase-like enzyme